MTKAEPILEFPCAFSIKSIGENDDYLAYVLDTVQRIIGDFDHLEVSTRLSNGGKYLSVTVPFIAQSREQVDALYQALNQDERTRFVI